ncbi:MAG: hypothetical protein P8008_07715 [Gammaproteobacteria bacterium]
MNLPKRKFRDWRKSAGAVIVGLQFPANDAATEMTLTHPMARTDFRDGGRRA